jgi:hypothetical protein
MDSQTNVQKRKRAITLEDQQIIDGAADDEDQASSGQALFLGTKCLSRLIGALP